MLAWLLNQLQPSSGPSNARFLLCHCYITGLHMGVCKHKLTHPDTANTHQRDMRAHTHTPMWHRSTVYIPTYTHPYTTQRLHKYSSQNTHEHVNTSRTCVHHPHAKTTQHMSNTHPHQACATHSCNTQTFLLVLTGHSLNMLIEAARLGRESVA